MFLKGSTSLSDSISPNTDEVLSINPSANVFFFGNFKINYKDWLAYSGGTDLDLVNSVIIFLSQTTLHRFPTRIPDYDSHSHALLDLLISSDATVCSATTSPPLGSSDHVVVSVSQQDAQFHCIAYDYSRAD